MCVLNKFAENDGAVPLFAAEPLVGAEQLRYAEHWRRESSHTNTQLVRVRIAAEPLVGDEELRYGLKLVVDNIHKRPPMLVAVRPCPVCACADRTKIE